MTVDMISLNMVTMVLSTIFASPQSRRVTTVHNTAANISARGTRYNDMSPWDFSSFNTSYSAAFYALSSIACQHCVAKGACTTKELFRGNEYMLRMDHTIRLTRAETDRMIKRVTVK